MLVVVLHLWSSFCCCIFICLCSSFCCCFFIHIFFSTLSLTLPWTIAGVFTPHFTLSAQPIAEWFATLSFFDHSVIFLPRALRPWMGIFLPTGVFYLTLLHRHFNLRLSRLPWKPAVLPWSLQGFILILETQTWAICLFDSQWSTISYSERFSFKFYYILGWIVCDESLIYLLLTRFKLFSLVQSIYKDY